MSNQLSLLVAHFAYIITVEAAVVVAAAVFAVGAVVVVAA